MLERGAERARQSYQAKDNQFRQTGVAAVVFELLLRSPPGQKGRVVAMRMASSSYVHKHMLLASAYVTVSKGNKDYLSIADDRGQDSSILLRDSILKIPPATDDFDRNDPNAISLRSRGRIMFLFHNSTIKWHERLF